LATTDPLYLGSPVKYIAATFVLHLIYGTIIGGMNPAWSTLDATEQATV
jgi:uncharacterized membrane protein YesL